MSNIKQLRAQLGKSLAQDATLMPDSPLSKSWDEPAMPVPDHRSPHLRALKPHPSAGLCSTLERPLSCSGIHHPKMTPTSPTFDRHICPAIVATRSPMMVGHGHHQSLGTGAALHHHKDSLRDHFTAFLTLITTSVSMNSRANTSRPESIGPPLILLEFLLPRRSIRSRMVTNASRLE
ncbi:uncharacterized protein VP01_1171g1 [Puccinia sorghi]|uniref:Uncharacterized protein n=1 Tax=Puccinia sorghi TaxID=27349 RepID=A0A0L6VR91_9BASI|nr:uncharacterized protein VP01_1171g1 [Puccinia sorghi]